MECRSVHFREREGIKGEGIEEGSKHKEEICHNVKLVRTIEDEEVEREEVEVR